MCQDLERREELSIHPRFTSGWHPAAMSDSTPGRSRFLTKVLLGSVVFFALIQLVPYGRDHRNPPVRREPAWDSPRTRELAVRACFDCHSNQVRWPWYSDVAPVSWLIQHDVDEARSELNFSEWDRPQEEADEAGEEVAEGEMPLWSYRLAHPEARLSDRERRELVAGLDATVGRGGSRVSRRGRGGGDHDDDRDDDHGRGGRDED
jgi:hypothetical protein